MVQIQNSSTIRELIKAAGLTSGDGFPSRLAESVVPVIDINPAQFRVSKVVTVGTTTTGAATVLTTSTTKDTFVTAAHVSMVKDATCDVATGFIGLQAPTVDGVGGTGRSLLSLATITTTAQNQSLSISFPNPVQLARGVSVQFAGAFTVGVMSRSAGIEYYEVEPFENRP